MFDKSIKLKIFKYINTRDFFLMELYSREFDQFLSRWIASESIFHLKTTSYWTKPKWISKIKVHKIIFNVANKFDLPITRSWYIHGGYIHDYEDLDEKFSSLASNSIRLKLGPVKYRSIIKKKYSHIDTIIDYIKHISDEVNSYKVNDYLLYLYKNEAPEEYKSCYLSKYDFSSEKNSIKRLSQFSLSYIKAVSIFLKIIDKIYDQVANFDANIYGVFEDKILEQNARNFFDLLEDSLRKVELIVNAKDEIPIKFFNIINDFASYFVYDIWRPYACTITNNTVRGPWSENVIKINSKIWRNTAIMSYNTHIKKLEKEINRLSLKTSYKDMHYYYNTYKKDDTMNDVISLLNNYEKKE